MEKKDKKYLSASRIKTLESCSWVYWCKYHLKLPDKSNDGALRGSVCHLIFEMLIGKNRKKYFNKIIKTKKLSSVPSVDRLVKKWVKKYKLSQENYDLIEVMIVVGLETDFYGGSGVKILDPEFEFKIVNEEPEYNILGFIDKVFLYPKGEEVIITDYKTSKEKFKGSEVDCNLQGLMYSLVARRTWPEYKKVIIKFIFLKFPEDPIIEISFTDEEIEGFGYYLEYLNKKVTSFTEKEAKSSYAADMPDVKNEFKGRVMCGRAKNKGHLKKDGKPMWHCPFKFDFEYYVIINEKGDIVKSAFEREDLPSSLAEGQIVEKRDYKGCPRYSGYFFPKDPKAVDIFAL